MDVEVDFDAFARAQLPSLVRFVAALTGDTQLAQDLVQDTLVRAYTRMSRVAGAERPDLYLRRMVLNGYLSWRRRWYQRTVQPVADPAAGPHPVTPDPAGRIAERAELAVLLGRTVGAAAAGRDRAAVLRGPGRRRDRRCSRDRRTPAGGVGRLTGGAGYA